jgi:hypothetical protein
VSVSEQVDDSPSGSLLHGIMAAIAEHYSRTFPTKLRRAWSKKVRRGGTPNYAPLGYLNHTERVNGVEVKTVIFDPDRAPHVKWVFEQYATGQWSISTLRDALEERGFKSRTTRKLVGKPISSSQLHRMLTHPYDKGQVVFNGVLYDGNHEPLVDEVLWQRVQDVLAGRRIAGDRSWRHIPTTSTAHCAVATAKAGWVSLPPKGMAVSTSTSIAWPATPAAATAICHIYPYPRSRNRSPGSGSRCDSPTTKLPSSASGPATTCTAAPSPAAG